MATTSLGYNVPAEETISLLSYDVSVDGVSILVDDAQTSSAPGPTSQSSPSISSWRSISPRCSDRLSRGQAFP